MVQRELAVLNANYGLVLANEATDMTHKRLLNVGCGPRGHNHGMPGFDGWVETRLDIDPSLQPDVMGSMTDMSAIASASVDAIVSSHNIEHLSPPPGALGLVRVPASAHSRWLRGHHLPGFTVGSGPGCPGRTADTAV